MEVGMVALLTTLAAGIGLFLGWLLGRRAATSAMSQRDGLGQKLQLLEADRATLKVHADQVPSLRSQLDELRQRRDVAERALAALEAAQAERDAAHRRQLEQAKELGQALESKFQVIASDAITRAQNDFLTRAEEGLKRNESQLKGLLSPVEVSLKRYDDKIDQLERTRASAYGELMKALDQLGQTNQAVRAETSRLSTVLRSSPKARGRWGEEQLKNILEAAGLAQHVDYVLQLTVEGEEGKLRPDCIIKLPGGHRIAVDVKCPLVAYQDACESTDDTERAAHFALHAKAVRSYAESLAKKSYWEALPESVDFVIMFIPGEHLLSAAAEHAPDLIDAAFRKNVIIASTINLLALAKVMAGMWRQDALASQAQEIAELGKELYTRLVTMTGHVARLGKTLESATVAYNDLVGSLEGRVLVQARRLKEMHVDAGGREIAVLHGMERTIRPVSSAARDVGAEEGIA